MRNMLSRKVATYVFGLVLAFIGPASYAEKSAEAPFGTASFSGYDDIESLKQLKVVWDWSFEDPKQANIAMNFLGALLRATTEFGPKDFEPIKVVVVSHGPEVVLWAKKNYGKYKEIVDRAASFAQQGVRFEICRNDAAALGYKPEDLHGFTHVVPAGPYALAYWQNKGYAYIVGGATNPMKSVTQFNKDDLGKTKK